MGHPNGAIYISNSYQDGLQSASDFFGIVRKLGMGVFDPADILAAEQAVNVLLRDGQVGHGYYVKLSPLCVSWIPCDGCKDPYKN